MIYSCTFYVDADSQEEAVEVFTQHFEQKTNPRIYASVERVPRNKVPDGATILQFWDPEMLRWSFMDANL